MQEYSNENPIIKSIYGTYCASIKADLDKNYFPEVKGVKKWMCSSDYAYDKTKPNHLITFTIFPCIKDLRLLMDLINSLAFKEIKNTKLISPSFINFVRASHFVNFAFILENHKYLFLQNHNQLKDSILQSLKRVQEAIPMWMNERPHLNSYHNEILKKVKEAMQYVKDGKKIKILKNLFLATSIGSFLCTQFANETEAELFAWFSDRDEINDLANNLSADLFNIQFCENLTNPNCQFVSTPAGSNDNEWHRDLIKIPDYISGALADYNLETGETSHSKFNPLIEDLIANNNRNVFVFKIKFNEDGSMECARITFKKVD